MKLPVLTRADDHPVLRQAETELTEYFAGKRKRFTVALDFAGTDFQKRVWQALLEVPEGQVTSYQQLAAAAGSPGASRAVGTTMASNPIGYLIPCHRVLKAGGAVGDYRWGVERKQALLALEAARVS